MTSTSHHESGVRAQDTIRFLRRRHQERMCRLAEQSPRAIAARLVARVRLEARGEPELMRLAIGLAGCALWVQLQPQPWDDDDLYTGWLIDCGFADGAPRMTVG